MYLFTQNHISHVGYWGRIEFSKFFNKFFKKIFIKKEVQIFFCLQGFNDIRSPAQVFLLTIVEKL